MNTHVFTSCCMSGNGLQCGCLLSPDLHSPRRTSYPNTQYWSPAWQPLPSLRLPRAFLPLGSFSWVAGVILHLFCKGSSDPPPLLQMIIGIFSPGESQGRGAGGLPSVGSHRVRGWAASRRRQQLFSPKPRFSRRMPSVDLLGARPGSGGPAGVGSAGLRGPEAGRLCGSQAVGFMDAHLPSGARSPLDQRPGARGPRKRALGLSQTRCFRNSGAEPRGPAVLFFVFSDMSLPWSLETLRRGRIWFDPVLAAFRLWARVIQLLPWRLPSSREKLGLTPASWGPPRPGFCLRFPSPRSTFASAPLPFLSFSASYLLACLSDVF